MKGKVAMLQFWDVKTRWCQRLHFFLRGGIAIAGSLLVYGTLFAADNTLAPQSISSPWRIALGTQWSHEHPELSYTTLNDSTNPELSINQWSTNDFTPHVSRGTLEKQLSSSSAFSFSYNQESATSLLVGKKNVLIPLPFLRFLLRRPAIMVRTTMQAPVTLNIHQLRLRYEHAITRQAGIELGGALGMQALYTQAKAAFPVLGYSKEEYFLLLPLVSLYARSEPLQRVRYTLRAEYLPIRIASTEGTVADVECTMEYKLNARFFVGVGGRYALKSFSREDENEHLDVSYPLLGAMFYTGIFL